jgi:hyperosmotically inducible periplasmic protein
MKRILVASSLIALAAIATGCNRTSGSAYNNSGTSAANPPSTTSPSTSTSTTTTTTAPDTASPNVASPTMAPGPAGNATGAVSETITTGKVKAAIAADSGLKDSDISVTTNNGVVTLSGTVKSQDQVAIATNLAQRQEGVSKVDTQIVVR